jgi:adenylate kinase
MDGSELYQRDDDKPETVERRIRVYSEQTAPLIEYYRKAGLLAEVDGTKPIEQVSAAMLKAINKD